MTFRNLILIFFILTILLSFNGCFFGTFQSAKTIGKGNMGGLIHFSLPVYSEPRDLSKEKLEVEGNTVSIPPTGIQYTIGIEENLDLTVYSSLSTGLGTHLKYMFHHNEVSGVATAVLGGICIWQLNYLLPHFAIIRSKDISDRSSIFVGVGVFPYPDGKDNIHFGGEISIGIKKCYREKRLNFEDDEFPILQWILFPFTRLQRSFIFEINIPYNPTVKYRGERVQSINIGFGFEF